MEELIISVILIGGVVWYLLFKPLKESSPILFSLVIIGLLAFGGFLLYTWVKNKAQEK